MTLQYQVSMRDPPHFSHTSGHNSLPSVAKLAVRPHAVWSVCLSTSGESGIVGLRLVPMLPHKRLSLVKQCPHVYTSSIAGAQPHSLEHNHSAPRHRRGSELAWHIGSCTYTLVAARVHVPTSTHNALGRRRRQLALL